jgi:hypothetical protein
MAAALFVQEKDFRVRFFLPSAVKSVEGCWNIAVVNLLLWERLSSRDPFCSRIYRGWKAAPTVHKK